MGNIVSAVRFLELPKVFVFTAVSGQVSCFYNYQTLLLHVLISVFLLDCILQGFGVSVATHKSRCEISVVSAIVLATPTT